MDEQTISEEQMQDMIPESEPTAEAYTEPDKETLQKQINDLIVRRIDKLRELENRQGEKKSISEEIKSLETECDGIDKLLREKMDMMLSKGE